MTSTIATARSLRHRSTDAESLLWRHLRDRQLSGYKFRRQAPVGPFFADFLCFERKLILEIDGGQHTEASDAARTRFLRREGYRVLRFWNNQVLMETDAVLAEILRELTHPHPNPLPQAGEGEMHA
jgi:adenine-specific DNA-methyltransferase